MSRQRLVSLLLNDDDMPCCCCCWQRCDDDWKMMLMLIEHEDPSWDHYGDYDCARVVDQPQPLGILVVVVVVAANDLYFHDYCYCCYFDSRIHPQDWDDSKS